MKMYVFIIDQRNREPFLNDYHFRNSNKKKKKKQKKT